MNMTKDPMMQALNTKSKGGLTVEVNAVKTYRIFGITEMNCLY